MHNNGGVLLIAVLVVLLVWWFIQGGCSKEGLSGFGVTSALNFYDRLAYCDPGQNYPGAAYSGGCYLPHRVIV